MLDKCTQYVIGFLIGISRSQTSLSLVTIEHDLILNVYLAPTDLEMTASDGIQTFTFSELDIQLRKY